ncbi:MAG TPA: mechanosensitive ion channel [Flavobacteriales bacterium]|nr:mechanosensitive ion channel [Flavobacteriales bacterium]HMR26572.1 mechanosensitive ion channel [Flavobacteriales bacterium]
MLRFAMVLGLFLAGVMAVAAGPEDVLEPRHLALRISRAKQLHAQALPLPDTAAVGAGVRDGQRMLDRLHRQLQGVEGSLMLRGLRAIRSAAERVRGVAEGDIAPLQARAGELADIRTELVGMRREVEAAAAADSALAELYARERSILDTLVNATVRLCDERTFAIIRVVDAGLDLSVRAVTMRDAIAARIVAEERTLVERRHGPVWAKADPPYAPFGDVVARTGRSILLTVAVVWDHLPRQLLPSRVLLLALLLLPVFIAAQQRGRDTVGRTLFHEHGGALALLAMAIVAPFTVVRAPQLFHDLALIAAIPLLAWLLQHEYPGLDRRRLWAAMALVLLVKVSNLLVEPTLMRRWLLVGCIVFLPLMLRLRNVLIRGGYPHPRRLRMLVGVSIAMLAGGWVLNVMGWYRLGSNLVGVSLDGLIIAIALALMVRLAMDGLTLLTGVLEERTGRARFDPERARPRLVGLLNLFGLLVWAYAVLNGMDLWDVLWVRLGEFLEAPRALLGVGFTWMAVVAFFGSFALAIVLSELVKDLFSEEDAGRLNARKQGGTVLLVRLALLVAGGALALWSSGIPVDRLVVLMGAFGLGIGLGFQQLANNLVSGIMLAMERPVRPGDEILVQGRLGIIRDIGLRSTRVSTYAGSTLVVPNAMLVSDLVENRTMNDPSGRLNLHINIPLDNDLRAAHAAMAQVLEGMAEPGLTAPQVHLVEMDRYWARFEVLLWVGNITRPYEKRDAVLAALAHALREHGITWNLRDPARLDNRESERPAAG